MIISHKADNHSGQMYVPLLVKFSLNSAATSVNENVVHLLPAAAWHTFIVEERVGQKRFS